MKYYIKSKVFILFLIIITGLILVWTTRGKDDSTIARLNNVNVIFEGKMGETPIRIRMYKENNSIYANLVMLGNSKEIELCGKYNSIQRKIILRNDDIRMQVYASGEDIDYYIGKITQKGNVSDISIRPCYAYAGEKERDIMYQIWGYDTQILDKEVNNVIQYIRSDKREKVADMIAYPITVTTNNGRMIFATKKEFLEHYDQIIDQTIIAGAEKEFTAFWLVGCDNIGIVDGRVRLVYSEDKIKIIAISNKTQY